MKKNKHYITEHFDFNEVLDNSNSNDDIINTISNRLSIDNIIEVIKNTFGSSHDYKYSKFTISDDKRIIAVTTTLLYSEYQQLQTRFIINEDDTIYVDYRDCGSIKDSIKITTLISQILQNIQKLLVTPVKYKTRIITPYYISTYTSAINGLTTLNISYSKVCFIIGMVKNGYKDISILNSNMGLNTDIDKNSLQYYNFGNIVINKSTLNIDIIDNDIINDFINYAQTYMLPDSGYVLLSPLPVNSSETALLFTYLEKIKLCKFNDKDTLTAMKQTKFKITSAEVKLMCRNILYNNTEGLSETINKLTSKISLDKLDKFYIRIVLASIFSGNIASIMENYKSHILYYKNELDPSVLKAYYNYVIDDIRNHGPIYNQIISYNV